MFKTLLLKIAGAVLGVSFIATPQSVIQTKKQPAIKAPVVVATTTPKITKFDTKTSEKKKVVVKTTKSAPIVVEPPEPTPDLAKINTFAREATVNILCTIKNNDSVSSGTGTIVTPDGLILTNAHVAQYFLLTDYPQKDGVDCVIRNGSPAYPRYRAELVYISPTWVADNNTVLKDENPKGTGENDFAFLQIIANIDKTPLKLPLPYVPINTSEHIRIGSPVVLVSYPAGFLGGITIVQNLNITSAETTVQDVLTFKEGTGDILSVGGTVVSQKGASGGAVVDGKSSLIGVISTESDAVSTDKRGLYAITPAHINRAIQKELGITLLQFLRACSKSF